MTVYILRMVNRGGKNTRWMFADGYGSKFDGLLPNSGNYRIGQELDKDAFSSIRELNDGSHTQIGVNAVAEAAAERQNYVDLVTGETCARNMSEAEFEAFLEI